MISIKNKSKSIMTSTAFLGIFAGRYLYRNLGDSSYESIIRYTIIALILLVSIMFIRSLIRRKYQESVAVIFASIPMLVGGVGIYLDDINIMEWGLLSIFIVYPVLLTIILKLKKSK